MTNQEQVATKIKKEIEVTSEKIKSSKLKVQDLLIPIIIGIILVFITIFVFIPMISTAFDLRKELKDIKSKQEQMTTMKNTLSQMNEKVLEEDLRDVKNVIPRTLRVSSFIYYIDELAKNKNLTSETISAGDIKLRDQAEEKAKETSQYKGVNGPLAYSGILEDVLSFLDSFYTSSPYIVSPENIKLQGNSSDDTWKVTLSLTGYYISEEDTKVDIYRPFRLYTGFSDVLALLKNKAKRLGESN